jgi:hypothetical protein
MAEGYLAMVLEIVSDHRGKRIRLAAAANNPPQSLSFGLSTATGLSEWQSYLGKLRPTHCEIIDAVMMPPQLALTFAEMKIPVDLWIADGTSIPTAMVPERQQQAPRRREDQQALDFRAPDHRHVQDMISAARRILVPTEMARAYASQVLRGREITMLEQPTNAVLLTEPSRNRTRQLAIVPTRSSAKEFRIIRSLVLRLRRDLSIIVAGSTFDDLRLMSNDNVFVSGPLEASELGPVLRPHNIGWMLTGFDGPLFGHPLIEAVRAADVPVAYLDWSRGAGARRAGDLAMDPDLQLEQLVDQVATWIEGT